MAETIETIGTKLDALGAKLDVFSTTVDKRFEQVDKRFDELKSELGTRIEAVDAKVDLVVEGFGNLLKKDAANSASHAQIDARLDSHDLRLTALESRRRMTREAGSEDPGLQLPLDARILSSRSRSTRVDSFIAVCTRAPMPWTTS
jgi:chaperonin cofactor prefoldin